MILTGLIFIFFQLTDLAQEMRRQGVDIFPDCDSHCYIEGLPLKDIQTERHLYHCMALTANSLNFTWSRWNLLSGYDKLIMQYREKLPGAPGEKLVVCLFVCNRGDTILRHGELHTDLNQCNQGS